MKKFTVIRTIRLIGEVEAETASEASFLAEQMGGAAFEEEEIIREELISEDGKEWVWFDAEEGIEE